MAKIETLYPVEGSSALKARSDAEGARATIIAFPGARVEPTPRTASSPTGYEQLTSLFTRPLSEREFVRVLKHGTLAGSHIEGMSKRQGIVGGLILFAIALAVIVL